MNVLSNINPDNQGYEQIITLYQFNQHKFFEQIPVSIYQWFQANMTAPLGAIFDLLENNLNDIEFAEIDEKIKIILQRNNFLSHFGFPTQPDGYGTTIPYVKLKPEDSRYFHGYLQKHLFNRPEMPNMSIALRKKMSEAILELFANAQIHSQTKHIYTCGQFFPKKEIIEFTIVDTGIGFQESVQKRFKRTISSIDAIRWAIQEYNTTKTDVSGGIGLALLHEFVQKNRGMLQIISYDAFYENGVKGERIYLFSEPFPGTIVNVQFRTNDMATYLLSDEIDSEIF